MSKGTIWVLTLTTLLLGIFIYFSIRMNNYMLIIPGVVLLAIGILVTLPDTIKWAKGVRRTHLLKSGKLKEEAKKVWNPKSRFEDND